MPTKPPPIADDGLSAPATQADIAALQVQITDLHAALAAKDKQHESLIAHVANVTASLYVLEVELGKRTANRYTSAHRRYQAGVTAETQANMRRIVEEAIRGGETLKG